MSKFIWHSKKIVLLFSFMAIAVIKLFATDEKYKSQPMEGSSGQIRKDSVRTVADTVFFNPALNATVLNTYSVQNVITFKIYEYANRVLPDSFKVKLRFSVDFTNNLNQVITKTDSLTIDYNKLKSYTNKSVYLQTGYYKSVLKILDVIPVYGDSSVFLPSLMVENEIWINRDYQFNCSNNAIRAVNKDIAAVATDGELKVFWGKERTADEYDLEWTYIDSTAVDNYYYSGTTNFDPVKIFDDNASRVSIKREDYKIPLLYDNGGILFFRVRSVQVKPNSQRIEANWSTDYLAQGGLGRFDFGGHERNLNWQATTTYAEEGKRKSVVQYFDGSLKGRQTVTKDNSTNTTVVAETFYDFQGRPVIQVLPSPTLSTIIKFTPDFNPAINGAEYDKNRYDYELTNPNDYCAKGAEALGIQSGASKYYSINNPEKTDGFNKFIPDANAFPFTETVYTQDNTGRIIKQSGVGLDFKIGSGHETKYYYGSADQEELDALFGTEVGNATHYFKNMVRDANGQYSVSYVDMRGRTIATALAGDKPSSLDKLPSNVLRTITKKLVDSTNNQVTGTLIESSKALLVPKSGSHRFIYSLAPDSIRIGTCASTSICYDCMYDLEITITDDCNNSFNNGSPVRIVRSNVSLNPADTLCNPFSAFPQMDTTLFLAEGSYLVTKRLTISKPALDYYRDSIFLAKNTCKKLEDFIEEEKQIIRQQLQCEPDCQSCMASLGTWESFRNNFMQEMGISPQDSAAYRTQALLAYQRQLEECNELCEQRGLHKSIRQAMLMDMTSPFGQYADPDQIDNYSIFYKSSTNSPYIFQTVTQPYLDADGKPDSIAKDGIRIPPTHNSISKEEFAENFKPSWAESLLPLHPEFCRLQKIEEPGIASSYIWDERFEKTETYQAAIDSGYLNPTANGSAPFSQFPFVSSKRDPFFDPAVNPTYANAWRTTIENKMLQPQSGTAINIWSLATAMVKCDPDDNACFDYYATNQHAFEIDAACTGDKDMAWRNFRELYMNEKRKIIDQILNGLPCQANVITVPPHSLNFPPFAASTTGSGPQDAGSGKAELNQFIDENCRLYASQWWNQVKSCNFTLTDSAVIIPRLIEVCKEGGDENHVFGSSSVAPGSGYRFKSFQEVLKQYADSTGKVMNSNSCNPYLIIDPPPYDQPAIYSNVEQWDKPDSCQCSRIDTLYTAYLQNPSGYSSFSAYINAKMNVDISEADLQTLRGLCNGTITCNYLDTPVTIPPSLQCSGAKACINCEDMASAYSQFLIEFPNAHKISSDDEAIKVQYYQLFENYLNIKLGYRKSYSEYMSFMNDCKIFYYLPSTTVVTNAGPLLNMPVNGDSSVANVSCDTLQSILNQFYSAYPLVDKWNLITLKRKQVFFPYEEYLLSCTGTGGGQTTGQTTNPVKWMGSGFRTSPSQWYRNNLTFMRFNFKTLNGKHSIDSINLRVSPVLTDSFQANVSFGNMSTLWDSTLVCSQLGSSFWASKTQVYTPLYQYNSLQGNPIYTYNCKTAMLNLFRFPTIYRGNILASDLAAGVASNSVSFIGSSNPIAQSDTATGPRVIVIYKIDTLYSCEDLVTSYFNYRLNTRLTYDSLKTLYQQKCGSSLPFTCQSLDSNKLCGLKEPVFPTKYVEQYGPCDDSTNFAVVKGTIRYEAYRDSLHNVFEEAYLAKCQKVAKTESLTVNLPVNEYHYTLYYYDQAGNLVKTIPPEGVDVSKFGWAAAYSDSVKLARKNNTILKPVHVLQTDYRYNTLNQVVAQNSPDGGLSTFWYDRLGRLAISQNAKQRTGTVEKNRYYSYTRYDWLGRINEVGQIRNPSTGAIGMTDIISRNQGSLNNWITNNYTRIDNVTRTYYDIPNSLIQPQLYAINLRNRVAYTSITLGNNATPSGYAQATYYSYDIHGNVDTLLQDYGNSTVLSNVMNANGNRWKKISYNYDLGKVNEVHYQPGQKDRFYHRYEYDAENRLTNVYTSYDKIIWEQDARYEYYKHGPLARSLIGEQLVQGMDYAYNLQGWVKGVNSTSLNPDFDMGEDGKTSGQRRYIARDAYSFNLNYFTGDYTPINGNTLFPNSNGNLGAAYKPLYNGNISSMAVNIGKITSLGSNAEKLPKLYNYSYDQLNRLTGMDTYNGLNETNNEWSPLTPLQDYKERIAYDANGNILKYLRQGFGANLPMDSLTYNYTYSAGRLSNNKLNYVRDRINNSTAHSSNYTEDIDDQASGNYTYDAIGNLTKDTKESITSIVWNVYGKITQIVRTATADNPVTNIQYAYDGAGNRISKRVAKTGTTTIEYTWYVRDAQGNVMATYNSTGTGSFASYPVNLAEQHLYGSSRLGVVNRTGVNMKTAFVPGIYRGYIRGDKFYELNNHLGNVLSVISDKKIGTAQSGNPTLIDYYTADIISASDYTPFGMQMVGRKFDVAKFRYGFNGKENDNDVKGDGNQQDYGMRIYDPRLGRFLSVDPITKKYPELTPYQFASNRPIDGIDLDGLEYVKRMHTVNDKGQVISTKDVVYYQMDETTLKAHGGTIKGVYNSAGYGPEGEGIKHEYYLQNGQKSEIADVWELRQNSILSNTTNHGLYSGAGCITETGQKNSKYDFSWAPIDIPDAIAKRHDENYANATGDNSQGIVEDTRTLNADNRMVAESDAFISSIPGRVLRGERVAGESIVAAKSQSAFIGILADYKQWKTDYMIKKGLDPTNPDDIKKVSLDKLKYKLAYIYSDKDGKMRRTANIAVLLAAKSQTSDEKK